MVGNVLLLFLPLLLLAVRSPACSWQHELPVAIPPLLAAGAGAGGGVQPWVLSYSHPTDASYMTFSARLNGLPLNKMLFAAVYPAWGEQEDLVVWLHPSLCCRCCCLALGAAATIFSTPASTCCFAKLKEHLIRTCFCCCLPLFPLHAVAKRICYTLFLAAGAGAVSALFQ